MNFDKNLSKIGGELRKLWTIEYFNIDGMGAAILNISQILKVVLLINLVYFGGNDCLSLKHRYNNLYHKNS